MPSVIKRNMLENFEEAGSHYTELKAVQAARISTLFIALLTTVLTIIAQ